MQFKLGKNIEVGQKIRVGRYWRKIKKVTEEGVFVKDSFIPFGSTVYGWRK